MNWRDVIIDLPLSCHPELVRISTAKDRPAGTETITSRPQSINGFGAWLNFFAEPSLFVGQTQFHNF